MNEEFTPNLTYTELRNALADESELTAELVSRRVCEIRRSKLPDVERLGNAGSFFKNPVVDDDRLTALLDANPSMPHRPGPNGGAKIAAGWLIDQCGLRGKVIGGAVVYERHALVITNSGDATPGDVLRLSREITEAVKARFGLRLEVEPTLIG
ncbi:MAG: hypothetical protein U5O39_17540 [Gammaproteobacteria bacterium]|nr:hypothetical protein [Gammaproteobacteria bacterium]